jgi:hypothetical protein
LFHAKLDRLLAAAVERKLLGPETAEALRTLAREQVRERGALTLAGVLGGLGGGAVFLGLILLIGANWDGIPDLAKLAGFLILLGGTHAAGLWITRSGLPYGKTAAALHFVGGGLFIGGVGLVAQIYHLDGRPPNGVLLWLVSLVPLAALLRSGSLTFLAIVALVVWVHMEGSFEGSPLWMGRSFTLHLLSDLAIGVALLTFSGLLRSLDAGVAKIFRACGILLFICTVYVLGFYRHWGDDRYLGHLRGGGGLFPLILFGLAVVGTVSGWKHLAPGQDGLRKRLIALLGLALGLGIAVLGVTVGTFGRGDRIETSEFGILKHWTVTGWALSILAWALWFALGAWCLAWGARTDRKAYINLGVLAIGAGIITRFFDLMGGLAETGLLFLLGGAVLLGTGFGMERWRRKLVSRLEKAA